jgi:hypothetical protein
MTRQVLGKNLPNVTKSCTVLKQFTFVAVYKLYQHVVPWKNIVALRKS